MDLCNQGKICCALRMLVSNHALNPNHHRLIWRPSSIEFLKIGIFIPDQSLNEQVASLAFIPDPSLSVLERLIKAGVVLDLKEKRNASPGYWIANELMGQLDAFLNQVLLGHAFCSSTQQSSQPPPPPRLRLGQKPAQRLT